MNSRSALVLCLVLSVSIIPALQLTSAQPTKYTERLDIYTAGSMALWLATFSGPNVTISNPSVVAAESVAGLNSYSLTAMSTASATTGSQLFWPDGYGILKVPFVPSQGAFLTLDASSAGAAQSVVASFDAYIGADFRQVSSSGNSYTYYSSSDFAVSGTYMFKAVPAQMKGLASLFNATTFSALLTPIIILSGEKAGGSFAHSVQIGSTQQSAVSQAGINLPALFSQATANIASSAKSNSTQVVVHSLDGLIQTADPGKVSNHQSNFSGSYTGNIPPGRKFKLNLTLVQDTPVLNTYRVLDRGSAVTNDLISVTVTIKNVAQSGVAQNIAVNESWWKAYPALFQFTSGNASFTIPTLNGGQNVSRVYVLKVVSGDVHDLTLPATPVTYSYIVQGVLFHRSSTLNQVEVRTNSVGPALSIQAGVDISSDSPIGKVGHYVVTVTNIGNGPALNLNVGTNSQQNLPQAGGVWKVTAPLPPPSIMSRNLSSTFTVTWSAPDGSKGSLTSNPASTIFTQSGALIPLLQLTESPIIRPGSLASGKLNITYTMTNLGSANATGVTLTQLFPSGFGCKAVTTGVATCSASGISLNVPSMKPNSNSSGLFSVAFSQQNYVLSPAAMAAGFGSVTLHTSGPTLIVPAGVNAVKSFKSNPVFQGMADPVTIVVSSSGAEPIFNLTASPASDVFTAYSATPPTPKTFAKVDPNGTQSFNYSTTISGVGRHVIGSVPVRFILAGTLEALTVPQGNITIYAPVKASATSVPAAPTEGTSFKFQVVVSNPSPVAVTNVTLTVPIPASDQVVDPGGMQAKGHSLVLNLPTMAAASNTTQTVTLKSGTEVDSVFANSTLTFQYQGATVTGTISIPTVAVGVDVLTRYDFPISLAVLLMLAAAVYIHRRTITVPAPGAK